MSLQNQNQTNPRVLPLAQDDVVSPEQIHIQIEEPPILHRIVRKSLYYTVGALAEPQEPRYSGLCVCISLITIFIAGMMFKKCS
jgi:hypothetical protein